MQDQTLTITLPDSRTITALRTPADDPRWTFTYAPGAGANIHDPFGAHLARELPAHGIEVVRFQFPYQEAGKRAPDRAPILETTWRTVIEAVRPEAARLAAGGRSMGGRIASHVIAQGTPADALILFAYPLHPPGRPEQARDAHLPDIPAPTLFISGTNDAFASPDELRAAAAKVPNTAIHLLQYADHGFNTPSASGRTRFDIWSEASAATTDFLLRL